MKSHLASWLLTLFVSVTGTLKAEQAVDAGLYWGLTLMKCRQVEPAVCVYYGEQPLLEAQFGIENVSASPVVLPPLAPRFSVELVREGRTIPIRVEWNAAGQSTIDEEVVELSDSASQQLRLGQGDTVRLSFVISTVDGSPLPPGRYQLIADFEKALVDTIAESAPWQGRAARIQKWNVVIQQPRTAEDRRELHRLEGNHLLAQKKPSEALPHLENWVRLAPGDRFALTSLGRAYVDVDRPLDAIRALEAVFPTVLREADGRGRLAVAVLLADAYVRTRDESNAARVLRMAGQREEVVLETLQRLRKR